MRFPSLGVFMNIHVYKMSLTIVKFYRHNPYENPDIQYVASLDLSHLSDDSDKFFSTDGIDKKIYISLSS